MNLRIYQSDKGDCMLLSGKAGGNILVDGGMRQAFKDHVRDDLGKLAAQGGKLDVVYVSHIDQDHIAGIVELLDNVMAWRVYNYRSKAGANVKPPAFKPLPAIDEIWHNAFSTLVGENAGPVESLLAQSSLVFGLSSNPKIREVAAEHQELAYSVSEAIQVSARISATQLNIPLNPQFGGKLAFVRSPAKREAKVGKMEIFVIGPAEEDVKKLKAEWNKWLRENQDKVRKLKKKAEDDARGIGASADRLAELLAARADELGDRGAVTTPNLASLMLYVKEGARSLLLTGDGHSRDILAGLEHHGRFDAHGKLHVNVLKMQHHGSKNNIDQAFCDRVTADHYVFCGNGKHHNPHIDVVDLVCTRHRANRPNHAFTLWFNCHPKVAPAGAPRKDMTALKKQVDAAVAKAKGKITAKWLEKSSFDLQL